MTEALNADEAFVGTVEPEGADRLDLAKLSEWMEANVEGFKGPLALTKFKGGQSNPTYKIEAASLSACCFPAPMRLIVNSGCNRAFRTPPFRSHGNMACAPMKAWSDRGSM
jgi:hypothetical protein